MFCLSLCDSKSFPQGLEHPRRSTHASTGLLLIFVILLGLPIALAQSTHRPCMDQPGPEPCVDKIDPPNWWANFSDPMLLLHGAHLKGAEVTVKGTNVQVARTQASANGHYLFVWLKTAQARPQTLALDIRNGEGRSSESFPLLPRKPANAGFQGFSNADALYLIMTDRFAHGGPSTPGYVDRTQPRAWHGGDFAGIEEHLDYLQQLGITAIWTTPVYKNIPSPQSYHGYSATDMYAVDPHFGTLADYQHLADAIHKRGMKIVLDTVPNHVGPAHPWAKDPPDPDWFHGTVEKHTIANGDFEPILDPHSSWQQRRDITQGWFANVLPDLNQENPLVAKYLIQNAIWWVETAGLDGLRLDTFPYVGRAFWHDFHAELHALFPRLTTVGEIFNPDPVITSYFAGGVAHAGIDTGLDTPFDFPMYFTLRAVLLHGKPMTKLEDTLNQDWLYPHPERLVPFVGNHDTKRFMSEDSATLAQLKLALGLLATLRGMPQIYSGDEIAMRGGDDPDNRRDFPGGFAGDPANAFTVHGRTAEQQESFAWASKIFRFREQHTQLQSGQQQDVLIDSSAFAFVRAADVSYGCTGGPAPGGVRFLVAVNNGSRPRSLSLNTNGTALCGCTRFADALMPGKRLTRNGSSVVMSLEAKELRVFEVE